MQEYRAYCASKSLTKIAILLFYWMFIGIFVLNKSMVMEFTGKIIAVLPLQTGTGKSGNAWSKQEYVIESEEKYPKRMCFGAWNDKINELSICQGESLKVFFNVDAREWQGRWFNEISAWKVERGTVMASNPQSGQVCQNNNGGLKSAENAPVGVEGDLPF